MPTAIFVVRATVSDAAKRDAFDRWYRDVHLPDASRVLVRAKRGGCGASPDPAVHQALYEFDDVAAMERAVGGAEMQRLIADFNSDWPEVARTRESFVVAEMFSR